MGGRQGRTRQRGRRGLQKNDLYACWHVPRRHSTPGGGRQHQSSITCGSHVQRATPESQAPSYLTDAHAQDTAPKLLRARLTLTIIVRSSSVPLIVFVPCFEHFPGGAIRASGLISTCRALGSWTSSQDTCACYHDFYYSISTSASVRKGHARTYESFSLSEPDNVLQASTPGLHAQNTRYVVSTVKDTTVLYASSPGCESDSSM